LAAQGLAPVLTQPKRERPDANPVGELVITNIGGVVDLKLSVRSAPATDILLPLRDPGPAAGLGSGLQQYPEALP